MLANLRPIPILHSRSLLSNFLKAIVNTHGSLPGDKLLFMLKVINGPVKLLDSNGGPLGRLARAREN